MSAPALSRLDVDRTSTRARPRPRPRPGLANDPGRWRQRLALAIILAVFAGRCGWVAVNDSITPDETTHLVHCLHFWMTGDDLGMWELGTPRLPHVLNALPPYLALRLAGRLPIDASKKEEAIAALVLGGSSRVLVPARAMAIGAGMALVLVVGWATGRRRGAVAGLIAGGLVSSVPEVLAHSAIAGSDVPFAAAAFLAIGLLARYAERPSPGRWLAASLGVGLAWAMRHTGLLLIPVAGGVHLVCALRRPRERGAGPAVECLLGSALAGAVLAAVAFLVLWAGDGFGTVSIGGVSARATSLSVPRRVGPVELGGVPVPTSALSVLKQVRHQNAGHEAYFCGAFRQSGWPSYFPVAFLLKTPLGLIALLVLAAARLRPRDALDRVGLACLALLWLTLVRSKVNIGVRYALLTYPIVIPWVARLFEGKALRDKVWGPATVAAAVWFVGASAWAHPRYLSYFNEIGGGPGRGWLYLADSNLDWGQDFDALAATLRRLGIKEVTADLSTERRLNEPGLFAVVNPPRDAQVPAVTPIHRRLYDCDGDYIPVYTRYVAVGASRLLGLYSQNDMGWLMTRRLVARVNDSTFLFDMDTPADRPFAP
ncbi:MAG TPA: glycosyltransferase family 39 protein [Isosphaeraceae bacterium]|nr:glycosyltransferase family 39 protein [Isosphaeraceae bacterium]